MSFSRALGVHAGRDPDRVAVVCGEDELTRAELDARSDAVAAHYRDAGVGRDQLVAIVLPNSADFFVAFVAAWKIGAIPLPLSHRLPRPELDAVLAVAQPALVVREPIAAAAGANGQIELAEMRCWKAMATGGSTGVPKVVLDDYPPLVDPLIPQNFMRLDGVILLGGPLYHSGPLINAIHGLLAGNTAVVMPRFDAEQALALIERHRVDWAFLVPTMQHRIWRLGEAVRRRYDISSLCDVVSSGGPFPAWLKEAMIGWLGADAIHEAYGGTEQLGGCYISGREALTHPGSVGRVKPGFEMQIRDERGAEVAAGEIGQIWFRSTEHSNPMYRYVGREADNGDGWDSFGDVGHVDAEGYLYIADRRTDLIVTGGANVYPAEVEAAIDAHPAVRSSAVIGLPDGDLGSRVHAIVDAPSPPIDEAQLRAHLTEYLAPYKVPRSFEFVSEPLRDDAGKVRRSALREARL